MMTKSMTANPSQIMIEQMVESGVKYVFYNSGSREASFFDALHTHPNIQGILALHEGSVTAMAGGYSQVKQDLAVMVVHLGAGLAQCLGQLINVWRAGLPVVVVTFAGDTGSYGDNMSLDLNHSFGPTSISSPFTKASWTVIEPEGLPQAIERAFRVAKTPPTGPVHLAIYDRVLGYRHVTADVIQGDIPDISAGYPADGDVEELMDALRQAKRPLLYVGDCVRKGAVRAEAIAVAESLGLLIAGNTWDVPVWHNLHGGPIGPAVSATNPDLILCVGVHHASQGIPEDFGDTSKAQQIMGIGSDVSNLKNIPGLDFAILADERRTLERIKQSVLEEAIVEGFAERRKWAEKQAMSLMTERVRIAHSVPAQPYGIRPWVLSDALDLALDRAGGGHIMIEQYAAPLDAIGGAPHGSNNVYVRPAGGSEGYGVGGAIGVKLAVPERPVVGLIGDGSLYYADSALWTTVHHSVPVLYVISNNQAYGIVADSFGRAGGAMRGNGQYAGVVLDGVDPVKIADGFGVEGQRVEDEALLSAALKSGLRIVEKESRPYLLDVRLPMGLPHGGRPAVPYRLSGS